MTTVYKYCPPERIDILKTGMVMLSKPRIFNDPFELKPHYQTVEEFVLPIRADATSGVRQQLHEMQAVINAQSDDAKRHRHGP